MKFFRSILIASLLVSFIACDKIVEELANSKTVLLTKKLWTFDSLSGYDEFGNLFAATFFTGTTYQFRPDGTYTAVILAQTGDSTWEFNADQTVITLEPGTAKAVFWKVITLSETELIITFEDADALAGIVTITFK
jgi:hypothetical protein